MDSTSTDHDTHEFLGSRFNVEILKEASALLHYIWGDYPFCTLSDCTSALTQDEELYRVLKVAHQHGRYEDVRKRGNRISLLSPPSKDTAVEAGVDKFLTGLQPTMRRLVAGEIIQIPTWSPTSTGYHEPETLAHLNSLKIPSVKGRPNLLLHDLGTFTHDILLERRLRNIFMPNNHTFLVNTSGSGKTRLLLEGLYENWGFYFTSLVDSSLLGSKDIENSIGKHVPDSLNFCRDLSELTTPVAYERSLETNRGIANRIFRRVFLARLMIFNLFAETMNIHINNTKLDDDDDSHNNNPHIYKARWLLLQLQPSFDDPPHNDLFDELSCKLSGASDSYINSKTKSLLSTVRSKLLSSAVQLQSSTATATAAETEIPLFCVLDEAQYAATQLNTAFRSDENESRRPILREIVKAWEGQSIGQKVFMVVAGTGISKDVVDQAMKSAIMKESGYRWCSDTGAFDLQHVQSCYLRKYLPRSFLETESGVRLIERVWYWLHGRHRFTAAYITELLVHGFKRPHGLLNEYVKQFTGFKITDASHFVEAEGSEGFSLQLRGKPKFSKLKKNIDMLNTIQELTIQYLMRSIHPSTLGKDEATYVEYGFARFVDAETRTVAVDEPLILLAAMQWINNAHQTIYKFFAKQIKTHNPDQDWNGFENYIAFVIDMIFSSSKRRRLKDVFLFNNKGGGRRRPSWSDLEAELVCLQRTTTTLDDDEIEENPVGHFASFGSSINLGINARSPHEIFNWLEHRSNSPLCFPGSSMGPDLIFILKLSDGSLIWVVLQAKYCNLDLKLPRGRLRDAMHSVTPSNFFLNKGGKAFSPTTHPDLIFQTHQRLLNLPNRRTDAGKYSLLRVVTSFPAETGLGRCSELEDMDEEGHPIVSLNMSLVKEVTRRYSPTDFLHGLEKNMINRKRNNKNKRKRGLDEDATTTTTATTTNRSGYRNKKIKLN